MAEKFQPNDLVMNVKGYEPGVRGIVLGYDRNRVMVCWETGYEPYTYHDEDELEATNVLDLLVEGRESEFRFEPSHSRCKCGRKLGVKKKQPFCTACDTYYPSQFARYITPMRPEFFAYLTVENL